MSYSRIAKVGRKNAGRSRKQKTTYFIRQRSHIHARLKGSREEISARRTCTYVLFILCFVPFSVVILIYCVFDLSLSEKDGREGRHGKKHTQ